jgi:hypothetical protein
MRAALIAPLLILGCFAQPLTRRSRRKHQTTNKRFGISFRRMPPRGTIATQWGRPPFTPLMQSSVPLWVQSCRDVRQSRQHIVNG